MFDPNKSYIYVNDKRVSVAAFLAMDKMTVTTVNASGCTGLTSPWFYAGSDARGYGFLGKIADGERRVLAGRRNYTIAKARKHWGRRGPSDRPDCLALVERIAAHDFGAEKAAQ